MEYEFLTKNYPNLLKASSYKVIQVIVNMLSNPSNISLTKKTEFSKRLFFNGVTFLFTNY